MQRIALNRPISYERLATAAKPFDQEMSLKIIPEEYLKSCQKLKYPADNS